MRWFYITIFSLFIARSDGREPVIARERAEEGDWVYASLLARYYKPKVDQPGEREKWLKILERNKAQAGVK